MNILHILNGSSTLQVFEQTDIIGDNTVWNEVLSEGPLEEDIASAKFWQTRSTWICKTFNETPENYQGGVIDHLAKLTEPYDELNLWFEYDLHCQSNMLGVMNYLKQQTDLSGPAIYLICPANFPGKENFMGMGELNPNELQYLFDNIRVQLSEIDFVIAAEAWAVYVKKDAGALKKYLAETTFWGSLHSLKKVLTAHLKRLEFNTAGLNYIEQKLLDIYHSGKKTHRDIHLAFWETEQIYGMGDLEIDIYLDKMEWKGLMELEE